MKRNYYVSKVAQSNGDYEVHDQTCQYLPKSENRLYLGEFESCHGAVNEAKKIHDRADGCKYCSPGCHKR